MSSQLVWFAMTKLCGSSGGPSNRALIPQILAAAPRNRLGQGERPSRFLEKMWIGVSVMNKPRRPAIRTQRMKAEGCGSALAVNAYAVKFHAMVDQPEAEPRRDAALKLFQFFVDELDDVAGFDVDQMVMVGFRRGLVA